MPRTADELHDEIRRVAVLREGYARRAWLLEQRCRGLRDDNPRDPRIRDLSIHIDALDEAYDRVSEYIGTLKNQLHEIEGEHALRCLCRGANLSEY